MNQTKENPMVQMRNRLGRKIKRRKENECGCKMNEGEESDKGMKSDGETGQAKTKDERRHGIEWGSKID